MITITYTCDNCHKETAYTVSGVHPPRVYPPRDPGVGIKEGGWPPKMLMGRSHDR